MRNFKYVLAIALCLTILANVSEFPNEAFAMGTPPGRCSNEYDGPITSAIINNGQNTFDVLHNSNVTFDTVTGYNFTFTVPLQREIHLEILTLEQFG